MDAHRARRVVEQAVRDVAPEADLAAVDPDDDLRLQLDLDSMDFLAVVQRLHDLTSVPVGEQDYPALSTLTSAVQWLVARSSVPAT